MDLTGYIIGFIWGIVVSYIVNKIYKYYKTKQVVEMKVVRVGYLQQNAFHKDDTYVPLAKQLKMMDVILYLNKKCQEAVAQGKVVRAISETGIFEQLIKMKYDIPNDHIEKLDTYYQDIDNALKSVA